MEIEEALSKLTARLDTLKGREKFMRIGNNQFDLNDKDPIYFISKPEKKQTKTKACVSCRDFIFSSDSQMRFCTFCGHSNCENCLYKNRVYPRSKIDENGLKPRGKICKLCDRKFLIR
jgi:hypothetical protein